MKIFISTSTKLNALTTWFLTNCAGMNRRATAVYFAHPEKGSKVWLPEIETALKSEKKSASLQDRMLAVKELQKRAKTYEPVSDKFRFVKHSAFLDNNDRLYFHVYAPDLSVTGGNVDKKCTELSKKLGLSLTFILEGKTVKITVN